MKNKSKQIMALGGFLHDIFNSEIEDPRSSKIRKNYLDYVNSPNRIESPNQSLIENNQSKAYADGASSTFLTQGLDFLGNLAMNYGTNQVMSEIPNIGIGTGKVPVKRIAAKGGIIGSNAEVEGGETGKTPEGIPVQFNGPKHENGGIDVNLPEGTNVFSDRIKVKGTDGKYRTMAERMKLREKKQKKLKDSFDKDNTDLPTKNALERTAEKNKLEELMDSLTQQGVKAQDNEQSTNNPKLKMGTGSDGFVDGSKYGIDNAGGFGVHSQPQIYSPEVPQRMFRREDPDTGLPYYDIGPLTKDKPFFTKDKPFFTTDNPFFTTDKPFFTTDDDEIAHYKGAGGGYQDGEQRTNPNGNNIVNDLPTFGDVLGMFGNVKQANDIYAAVQANRAGDFPNMNRYEDYGKAGLATMDKAKDEFYNLLGSRVNDIKDQTRNIEEAGRSSARSINTMRSLGLVAEEKANDSINKVYANFDQNLLGIDSRKAQMQDRGDQMRMRGYEDVDRRNVKDRDNYNSQLAEAVKNRDQTISMLGKDFNQIQERNVDQKLLNKISSFVNVDAKTGNVTLKEGFSLSDGSVQGAISDFTKSKNYVRLGYNPTTWDKLSNEEKLRAIVTQ